MSTTTAPREIRDATVHVLAVVVVGAVLAIASGFVSGTASHVLVLAAPSAVAVGTVGAMVRTYLNWHAGGRWQVWQGATWLLLALSLLWFTAALPGVIVG